MYVPIPVCTVLVGCPQLRSNLTWPFSVTDITRQAHPVMLVPENSQARSGLSQARLTMYIYIPMRKKEVLQ